MAHVSKMRFRAESHDANFHAVDTARAVKRFTVNRLMGTGNYGATSNNMKLVHWPLMGGLVHLVQQRGNWAGPQPTQSHWLYQM